MSILKDVSELLKAEVISQETADKIQNYYRSKGGTSTNLLFIVFGILGAILIGLGIILIIAHNWDELSQVVKTIFAFLPLIVGQLVCGFTLIKRKDSVAWVESSTAFLFFSVGASISLVSQIYNIPGNLSSFLLTWMLLCLPLIYVMKSSMASLLYIIGITYYAVQTGYWTYPASESYFYWILLFVSLPHYYLLYKKKPESNFMFFHNWLIPLSVIITLGTVAKNTEELMYIAYFSLFALFYLVGSLEFFIQQKPRNNGFKIVGLLGTIVLLLILSFDWFWADLKTKDFQFMDVITSPEFSASAILTLFAGTLLYIQQMNKKFKDINPIILVFILFIITFLIGLFSSISVVLINLFVFAIGILTIKDGAKQDHLGILNFGLLIITALVVCRFFDENISFVIRGILFLTVGVGFFVVNYWMIKKRKTNE
ncbi:DUF2157 domain-containing protein [Bacteroidota bacterium]